MCFSPLPESSLFPQLRISEELIVVVEDDDAAINQGRGYEVEGEFSRLIEIGVDMDD